MSTNDSLGKKSNVLSMRMSEPEEGEIIDFPKPRQEALDYISDEEM
jgi:hypothetical protein